MFRMFLALCNSSTDKLLITKPNRPRSKKHISTVMMRLICNIRSITRCLKSLFPTKPLYAWIWADKKTSLVYIAAGSANFSLKRWWRPTRLEDKQLNNEHTEWMRFNIIYININVMILLHCLAIKPFSLPKTTEQGQVMLHTNYLVTFKLIHN